MAGNCVAERLMNKVIHRSWGEGSATIFVDHWMHVSFSSSNFAYGESGMSIRTSSVETNVPEGNAPKADSEAGTV